MEESKQIVGPQGETLTAEGGGIRLTLSNMTERSAAMLMSCLIGACVIYGFYQTNAKADERNDRTVKALQKYEATMRISVYINTLPQAEREAIGKTLAVPPELREMQR